jgi:hypothetical protein
VSGSRSRDSAAPELDVAAPPIETSRLTLRPFRDEDVAAAKGGPGRRAMRGSKEEDTMAQKLPDTPLNIERAMIKNALEQAHLDRAGIQEE